jgi:uncharacterized membrane protein YhiD involved in acid resistance
MRRSKLITVVIVAAAVGLTLILYAARERSPQETGKPGQTASAPARGSEGETGNPFLDVMGGSAPQPAATAPEQKSWIEDLVSILFRLFLAVVFSGVLAFRPRKDVHLFKRSLFVSQTQILLAVVAAALMMIVGDNAARAFAIFAAVSLVRFRTNIRDPKEITVLLISLALGLAAGVGRWELGIALTLFALALLWLLEFNESEQVFRAMELTIKTRNTDRSRKVLEKLLKEHKLDAEVRQFDPPDEKDPVGTLVYYLNLRLNLSTDRLSDLIMSRDEANIEGIQWSQKKGASEIYQ